MIKKYNLALIPDTESNTIIELANQFCAIADTYLLSEHSLPHITLYQLTEDEHMIGHLWKKIISKVNATKIQLVFDEFSCITFDNEIFWISLMPNNHDFLTDSHCMIANIIEMPINISYDPHMTLMNTKNKDYEIIVNELKQSYIPVTDTFKLSLGECDDIGQYTKIIYVA